MDTYLKGKVRLVIYPAEGKNSKGVTVGHIYVDGGPEAFEVTGGLAKSGLEPGGHRSGITPPGRYVLDHAEHHTTRNWPASVVPWGAKLRERNEIVEYEMGGAWRAASGPHGSVTFANVIWYHRSRKHITVDSASRRARQMFYDENGELMSEWLWNDFGQWSW